jgi:peroxiredoxin
MNLLKSIFITSYLMLLMGVAGFAAWMLYQDQNPAAWGGVMLATAPLLAVISWLMMLKNVARTSAHFPTINVLGLAGVAIAAAAWYGQGADLAAPVLAAAAWVGFLAYAYWFSTFGGRQPSSRLKVGAPLPHFTVKSASGASLSSAQLTDNAAILIFYRGNWCPLCMAQIKKLAARYRDLDALGVRVAMISPQPHRNTVELANKHGVKFEFHTDVGNAAARILGIENVNGTPLGMQMFGYENDTVLPTVIITDRRGRVVWTHETDNYRIRPEPDIFLDVLRRNGVVVSPA